jgi:hypothetical protein
VIDVYDMNYIYASFLNGDYGYDNVSDINGDGTVDLADVYLAYYNYTVLNIFITRP